MQLYYKRRFQIQLACGKDRRELGNKRDCARTIATLCGRNLRDGMSVHGISSMWKRACESPVSLQTMRTRNH